jgi:hypothetical protein
MDAHLRASCPFGTVRPAPGSDALGDYTFTIEAREQSEERSEILRYDNDADAIISGRETLHRSHVSVGVGRDFTTPCIGWAPGTGARGSLAGGQRSRPLRQS